MASPVRLAADASAAGAARRVVAAALPKPEQSELRHMATLLMRVLDAIAADGAVVALAVGEGSTVVRGEPSGRPVTSVELLVEDRVLGTLEVHGSGALDPDESAYVALAADRIALLVAEHGL